MAFIDDVFSECAQMIAEKTSENISFEGISMPWDLFILLDKLKQLPPRVYGSPAVGDYVKAEGVIICGEGVTLRDYAYVRGPVILGDGVVLSAEVKESIVLSNTFAVHRNIYVGNTIIGRNCNIGAGTQFANLRFDERPVSIRYKGGCYETGRTKFGAIVEHDCKFGVNSSVAPGAYVGQGSLWLGSSILKNDKID